MEQQHTSGPWEIGRPLTVVIGSLTAVFDSIETPACAGGGVALVHIKHENYGANARLISAAPDLLAALKECLAARTEDEVDSAVKHASEAIEKATGFPDRNWVAPEGQVAPAHESAPTRAHGSSASGVTAQLPPNT